jgi:cell division protein FtsW (lipid II flippase)
MDKETHELYEYARKRIKQKKYLYYHFVFFLIGSLFMFVVNELLDYGQPARWYIWAGTIWFFIIILHFVNVYITNRFMNKEWERDQVDRLMTKQKNKIEQLLVQLEQDTLKKES